MSQLSQAVQEAVKSQLTGLVAEELKDFITTAQAQDLQLKAAQSQLASANNKIQALEAKLADHKEIGEREKALENHALELQQKEIALLKREAGLEAVVAKAELGGVKDTMQAFLKNPIVRTTIQEQTHVPTDGLAPSQGNGYSNPGYPGMVHKVDNKTTTDVEQQ